MKKRILICFIVVIIFALKSQTVWAQEKEEDANYQRITTTLNGKCGDDIVWSLSTEGKLTINGTGSMYNYDNDSLPPWYSYRDQIKDLQIIGSVSRIGRGAFYNCAFTKISLSSKITDIGDYAFKDCNSLWYIKLSNNLKSIGEYSFYGTDLGTIDVPASVTDIGEAAFASCKSMVSATLGNCNVTSLPTYIFNNCINLGSVTLPNNLIKIGDAAFDSCEKLSSIALPMTLEVIGTSAFGGCSSINNVVMPNSVTSIGDGAFGLCIKLNNIKLSSNLQVIGQSVFSYDDFSYIEIPNSVKSIGMGAFLGCTNLKEITIPASVNSIDPLAFMACSSLESIAFLNSSISIGENLCFACSNMGKVYGYSGSTASMFADSHSFNFIAYDEISHYELKLLNTSYNYDGEEKRPDVVVIFDGKYLDKEDYVVTYQNNKRAGTATVVVNGKERYAIILTQSFNITAKSIRDCVISLEQDSFIYDGKEKIPEVIIKDKTTRLNLNEDYSLVYSENINAGSAIITITGKGNYMGSLTKSFTISKAMMEVIAGSYSGIYDGKSHSITLNVNRPQNDVAIYYSTTTELNSSNYRDIGRTVKPYRIEGGITKVYYYITAENYNDVSGKEDIILSKANQIIVANNFIKSYGDFEFYLGAKATGDGKLVYKSENAEVVTVTNDGKVSIKGIGTAEIIITVAATANFETVSKMVTVTVNPKKTILYASKPIKKKVLSITWMKNKTASGYQIYYSTSGDFRKNTKSITIRKGKITNLKITGLKSKKKYYVKIRAYKKVKGKTYFSEWSTVKSSIVK